MRVEQRSGASARDANRSRSRTARQRNRHVPRRTAQDGGHSRWHDGGRSGGDEKIEWIGGHRRCGGGRDRPRARNGDGVFGVNQGAAVSDRRTRTTAVWKPPLLGLESPRAVSDFVLQVKRGAHHIERRLATEPDFEGKCALVQEHGKSIRSQRPRIGRRRQQRSAGWRVDRVVDH